METWRRGARENRRLDCGRLPDLGYTSGGTYRIGGLDADVRADAELAVELGRDVEVDVEGSSVLSAIVGYRAALEVVDLAPVLMEPEAVVATNVFHRAVVFGSARPSAPDGDWRATARVNGEDRQTAAGTAAFADRLLAAARVLEAVDERFRRGDLIIIGSIVQTQIAAGDAVEVEVGDLGSVCLQVAP